VVWVRILFAAWLAAVGAGTVFPGFRLWGLHLPAFLPLWGQVAFFGAALVLLVLPRGSLSKIIDTTPRSPAWVARSPLVWIVLTAAFVVFRSAVSLLGDGTLRGREAQLGTVRLSEILPGYFGSWVYDIVHPTFGWSGQDALAILSVFAGCLFLLLIWHFPRRIWDDPRDRLTARLVLALSGATALFFGYIESYAIPLTAMVGFLLSAEVYRRGKGNFFITVFFFILAVAAHFVTIVLFPALAVLSLARPEKRRQFLPIVGIIGLAAAGWGYWMLQGHLATAEATTGSIFVSFLPKPPLGYGLISPAHLGDIANLFLLVCPGVLIAAPLLLLGRTDRRSISPRLFWLLAVIIPLSIPLLIDPKLGMARDWDLLTLGVIPLLVWAAIRLADVRRKQPPGVLTLPVFASAAILLMFAGINAHTFTAITRFETLVELDKVRGGYGYEILAAFYRDRGRNKMEILQWRKALRLGENKRYWANLAMAYLRIGEARDGYFAARRAYLMDNSWPDGVYAMATAFNELEMLDSALVYSATAARLDPDNSDIRSGLAMILLRMGKLPEAQREIEYAIQLAPNQAMHYEILASILLRARQFGQAEPILKKVLELDSHHVDSHLNLAVVYHQTGRDSLALAILARLRRMPDLPYEQIVEITKLEKRIRTGVSSPGK